MTGSTAPSGEYAVVVPTPGRPGLGACLRALAGSDGPGPVRVVVVDDRSDPSSAPLTAAVPPSLRSRTVVVPGGGRGPAAARNAGWRAAGDVPWIVFLGDDVIPGPTWADDLALDLAGASVATAGIAARIEVPLPPDRRPTDGERGATGPAGTRWTTTDLVYRRRVLEAVGGFDERFRRAFRADADLALRVLDAGWTLAEGRRTSTRPVRLAGRWGSVRLQAGIADDVLLTRLHGRGWWRRAEVPRGRLPVHLAVASAGLAAVGCALSGRPRAAAACAAGWLAGTAEFALDRILPGPRTRDEIVTVVLTSALVPPAAAWHWLRGRLVHRAAPPHATRRAGDPRSAHRPVAGERLRS